MSAMLRSIDLTDEQVVKWVIYTLSGNGWHNDQRHPFIFIITKDEGFEEASRFKYIIRRTKIIYNRIKIIAPSNSDKVGNCKKEKLLEWIEYKLNQNWNRLSPV